VRRIVNEHTLALMQRLGIMSRVASSEWRRLRLRRAAARRRTDRVT